MPACSPRDSPRSLPCGRGSRHAAVRRRRQPAAAPGSRVGPAPASAAGRTAARPRASRAAAARDRAASSRAAKNSRTERAAGRRVVDEVAGARRRAARARTTSGSPGNARRAQREVGRGRAVERRRAGARRRGPSRSGRRPARSTSSSSSLQAARRSRENRSRFTAWSTTTGSRSRRRRGSSSSLTLAGVGSRFVAATHRPADPGRAAGRARDRVRCRRHGARRRRCRGRARGSSVLHRHPRLRHPLRGAATRAGRPGKRMNGLRVVRTEGQPIGFVDERDPQRAPASSTSCRRSTCSACVVDHRRRTRNQRLGDLAAGTLVVRERRADLPRGAAGPRQRRRRPWSGWDMSRITPEELAAVRQFLSAARDRLRTRARSWQRRSPRGCGRRWPACRPTWRPSASSSSSSRRRLRTP